MQEDGRARARTASLVRSFAAKERGKRQVVRMEHGAWNGHRDLRVLFSPCLALVPPLTPPPPPSRHLRSLSSVLQIE